MYIFQCLYMLFHFYAYFIAYQPINICLTVCVCCVIYMHILLCIKSNTIPINICLTVCVCFFCGGCGSVGRAGWPMTCGLVVQILAPPVHMWKGSFICIFYCVSNQPINICLYITVSIVVHLCAYFIAYQINQ